MTNDLVRYALMNSALAYMPPLVKSALIEESAFMYKHNLQTTANIQFRDLGTSFSREALFSAIREALREKLDCTYVDDKDGCSWQIIFEKSDGDCRICLSLEDKRAWLPQSWAFSEDQAVRSNGFERDAHSVNLIGDVANEWRDRLLRAPIENEDHEKLVEQFRLTPFRQTGFLASLLRSGACGLQDLVPNKHWYYDRLVGSIEAQEDLSSFAGSGAKHLIDQLIDWSRIDGLKLAFLISSYRGLNVTIEKHEFSDLEIDEIFSWVLKQGCLLSKLGAIELGLGIIDKHPRIESLIENIVSGILRDDINDEDGGFYALSTLVVFVCNELARTRLLYGKPPFWIRLAAIAQASVIERAIIASGIKRSDFIAWAHEFGGKRFYLQTLIDLRIEPRWLPDFVSPRQLKSEFLGRILNAAVANEAKISSSALREILLADTNQGGLKSQIEFPYPFLPGPIEGGVRSETSMPDEYLALIEEKLSSKDLGPNSFAGLVNLALILRLEADHARLAVNALRAAKYRLNEAGDEEEVFGLLNGLAVVAAVTRSVELAEEVSILNRVIRKRDGKRDRVGPELRIGLILAAAHSERENWATFVGDWFTELAFNVNSIDDAKRLLEDLRCMCELEASLSPYCGRADAALLSMVK
ncbi:hypothetical protein [Mesoterricola sediminis]|uniref:Uncharacterized protein n=1 Tax=Mesoterricola sediminis TaxID=2927980 RepID=A0AA48GNL7_9BACT|nr:hypothetical protein [Mesoterricola sediminis]BDU76421.1 hypothetical protein METESE_13790 [Mesoterricola sediminis]